MARGNTRILKILKALQDATQQLEEIEKLPSKYAEKLDDEAKSIISQWYKDFEPEFYHRRGSLTHAYCIKIKDAYEILVDFDPEYMNAYNHHQDNRIVFNNSFIFGYHGGSWGVDQNGIDSGVLPKWRIPGPYFTNWDDNPAPKSASPYQDIRSSYHRIIGINYTKNMRKNIRQMSNTISRAIT